MKELAALILFVVLIFIGWKQPYKAHFTSVVGEGSALSPTSQAVAERRKPESVAALSAAGSAAAVPQGTPPRDNSWLWNKTTMDAPDPAEKKGGKHAR